MIEDAKAYILTDVSLYIDEMLSSLDNLKPSPSLQPVCGQLLSATFLQMIGALEQKIYNIKWYLGFSDHSLRYQIQKDFSKQSTSPTELYNTYALLRKKTDCKCLSSVSEEIWNDNEKMIKAYRTVYNTFQDSNITKYTNREFLEYKDNYLVRLIPLWEATYTKHKAMNKGDSQKARTLKNLNRLEERYISLEKKMNQEIVSACAKASTPTQKKISLLKFYYERLMRHRHSIAHNFNAHRRDIPLIHELTSYIHRFDNYYYRYMICIYLDLKIQEAFSNLLKLHSKLLA